MGWQATGDPQAGGTPGRDPGLPGRPRLLAGFGHDGPWAAAAPSAALATALEYAAGPAGLYDGADTGALVGIARQWAAVESWAAAGKLAALRAMTREDDDGAPMLRRRADLPAGWDDSLTYEISGALAMGPVSAGHLASLAWALGTRLAGIGRLLADGTLTLPKARLVAQLFEALDEDEAARAEALVLGQLPGKTYPQVEKLAWRAALAVAPGAAERRRKAAERHARVTVFREESGAAGLSGRDLPAADALAGHASVLARARAYEASGAFPDRTLGALQALAFLHLLRGVTARDAIAFARASAEPPPGTREPAQDDPDDTDPWGEDEARGEDEAWGGYDPFADGDPFADDPHDGHTHGADAGDADDDGDWGGEDDADDGDGDVDS